MEHRGNWKCLWLICVCLLTIVVQSTVDHYGVLGVGCKAEDAEIKRAYRRLALLHHPDKVQVATEDTEKLFIAITTAYEVLSDPSKRREYDELTAGHAPSVGKFSRSSRIHDPRDDIGVAADAENMQPESWSDWLDRWVQELDLTSEHLWAVAGLLAAVLWAVRWSLRRGSGRDGMGGSAVEADPLDPTPPSGPAPGQQVESAAALEPSDPQQDPQLAAQPRDEGGSMDCDESPLMAQLMYPSPSHPLPVPCSELRPVTLPSRSAGITPRELLDIYMGAAALDFRVNSSSGPIHLQGYAMGMREVGRNEWISNDPIVLPRRAPKTSAVGMGVSTAASAPSLPISSSSQPQRLPLSPMQPMDVEQQAVVSDNEDEYEDEDEDEGSDSEDGLVSDEQQHQVGEKRKLPPEPDQPVPPLNALSDEPTNYTRKRISL